MLNNVQLALRGCAAAGAAHAAALWPGVAATAAAAAAACPHSSRDQRCYASSGSSSRSSSRAAAAQHGEQPSTSEAPPVMLVLPMPSLSHAMTSGRVSRWLKQPGQRCQQYDVLAEVTTDSLVEDAYKVDAFAGAVTLLLETQEDATLAAVLVAEGQEVPIGTPIAALCEHEGDVPAVAAAAPGLRSIPDLYDDEGVRCSGMQPFVQLLEWQSFLKDDKGAGGSGSCGCM